MDVYEKEHPQWLAETLLSLVTSSLINLRHYVESEEEKEVAWEWPVVELHFPVQWNWDTWERSKTDAILLISGQLTEENTADRARTVRTLSEIFLTHMMVLTMQKLTNYVGYEKRDEEYVPILLPQQAKELRRIKGKKNRRLALEELYQPFCITAAPLDIHQDEISPGGPMPARVSEELATLHERIDIPDLKFSYKIDGHALTIYLIFLINPLVVDVSMKAA